MRQRMGQHAKSAALPFFTIGYQAHSVESLIDCLNSNRIQLLVDVRQNPSSRKPGFSKRRLQNAITQAGIEYVHEANLGTPPKIRSMYRSGADITDTLAEYDKHISLNSGPLESLATLVKSRRVCLLCLETDHNMCHRSIIALNLCRITKCQPIHLI